MIDNQLKVLENFPSFFTQEEGREVGEEISLEEVQKVCLNFQRTKVLTLWVDSRDVLGVF